MVRIIQNVCLNDCSVRHDKNRKEIKSGLGEAILTPRLILNSVYFCVMQAWDMFESIKSNAHQFECGKNVGGVED
jgi:hypothetical protein